MRAFDCAMMSGTRKLPPISTSSPRLTMASWPAANSSEHHHDCRVVVHGDGGLGAGKRADEVLPLVVAVPRHVLDAVFERGVAARGFHHCLYRGLCQHAAAELVWMITPVALMTRLRLRRSVASAPLTASVKIASTSIVSCSRQDELALPVYRRTGAVDEHGTGDDGLERLHGSGISSSTWGNARKRSVRGSGIDPLSLLRATPPCMRGRRGFSVAQYSRQAPNTSGQGGECAKCPANAIAGGSIRAVHANEHDSRA